MLRRTILAIILNALALWLLTYLFDEITLTGGVKAFVIAGILFGFLNSLVKPFLKIISLPFVFLTAGLFIFIINAALLWALQFILNILDFDGIVLTVLGGWTTYLLASIVLAFINTIAHWLTKK